MKITNCDVPGSIASRGFSGAELAGLIAAAKMAPLRRHRILMHTSYDDPIQEMIVALMFDSDVRPHKHPTGSESYYILWGSLEVVWGEDHDHLDQRVRLDHSDPDGPRGLRLAKGVWHSTRAVSECAVFLEVGKGPFDDSKTVYCGSHDKQVPGIEK